MSVSDDDQVYVFSEIVFDYSKDKSTSKQVLDSHYEKYQDEDKERFRFKSSDNIYFASRYITDDYENILQTLEVFK